MQFAKEMLAAASQLERAGHVCFMPLQVKEYAGGEIMYLHGENADQKIEHDVIHNHSRLIDKSDAVLVLNYTKKHIDNYIGGNAFLEMGYAHVLNKKIFLLNPIPDIEFYKPEMVAMRPIILNGDLSLIKEEAKI
ncbi:MAG: hypothetical protein V1826_00070 [bacterium]